MMKSPYASPLAKPTLSVNGLYFSVIRTGCTDAQVALMHRLR